MPRVPLGPAPLDQHLPPEVTAVRLLHLADVVPRWSDRRHGLAAVEVDHIDFAHLENLPHARGHLFQHVRVRAHHVVPVRLCHVVHLGPALVRGGPGPVHPPLTPGETVGLFEREPGVEDQLVADLQVAAAHADRAGLRWHAGRGFHGGDEVGVRRDIRGQGEFPVLCQPLVGHWGGVRIVLAHPPHQEVDAALQAGVVDLLHRGLEALQLVREEFLVELVVPVRGEAPAQEHHIAETPGSGVPDAGVDVGLGPVDEEVRGLDRPGDLVPLAVDRGVGQAELLLQAADDGQHLAGRRADEREAGPLHAEAGNAAHPEHGPLSGFGLGPGLQIQPHQADPEIVVVRHIERASHMLGKGETEPGQPENLDPLALHRGQLEHEAVVPRLHPHPTAGVGALEFHLQQVQI